MSRNTYPGLPNNWLRERKQIGAYVCFELVHVAIFYWLVPLTYYKKWGQDLVLGIFLVVHWCFLMMNGLWTPPTTTQESKIYFRGAQPPSEFQSCRTRIFCHGFYMIELCGCYNAGTSCDYGLIEDHRINRSLRTYRKS